MGTTHLATIWSLATRCQYWWGRVFKWTSLNRSSVMTIRYHKHHCSVRSNVLWLMVTWGPPVNRQTNTRMHSSRMHTIHCSGCHIPACTGHGCVYPSMHMGRGVCIPAMHWTRGVSAQEGVCPLGVSAQEGVCPFGVSAWGCLPRWCLPGEVSAWGVCPGGCLPHPPVNRITDACENTTLPQLRCGR